MQSLHDKVISFLVTYACEGVTPANAVACLSEAREWIMDKRKNGDVELAPEYELVEDKMVFEGKIA